MPTAWKKTGMGYARAFLAPSYWQHGFSLSRAFTSFLSTFGALWLLIEITNFFSPRVAELIRGYWFLFLIVGLAVAFINNLPKHRAACRLTGRDVWIEIRVGDMFSLPGALIVGSNVSFDTDLSSGLISPRSVQGQFTEKYYNSVTHLDNDLGSALASLSSVPAPSDKPGKAAVYPTGTTIRLVTRDRVAYFVGVATLNSHGVAQATFEDLKTALPLLWECVATRGGFEPLIMPVLGSGFSRLPQTREEIIREIIKSFVAACAATRPTEGLTIVMPYKDFYGNDVNLADIERYLQHVCRYTEYREPNATGAGQAIP
jgi:hypothetical protein